MTFIKFRSHFMTNHCSNQVIAKRSFTSPFSFSFFYLECELFFSSSFLIFVSHIFVFKVFACGCCTDGAEQEESASVCEYALLSIQSGLRAASPVNLQS